MKERPILFSGAMVRALLAGTKTQTRRIVKRQPPSGMAAELIQVEGEQAPRLAHGRLITRDSCPYGQPGDRLWVREAWRSGRLTDRFPPREMTPHQVWYEADGQAPDACNGKLRPGMFMPRWASRITLELTGVRVERLQSISHEDSWDEGIRPGADGLYSCPNASFAETPVDAYRQLWEHLNGPKSWAENPWVWVVCFRRIEV